MPPEMSVLEHVVLFTADDDGRLPLPKGQKEGIRTIRTTLSRLKKKGLVYRERKAAPNCLPYALTKSEGQQGRKYCEKSAGGFRHEWRTKRS